MKPSDIVNLTEAYQTKIVSLNASKPEQSIVPVKPVQHTIMHDEEQPQSEEHYDNNESDASEMAQSDLKSIIEDATKILATLKTNVKMEPWIAAKITLASDYLNSAEKWLCHESEKMMNPPM
jgi:hypothetical protein